MRKMEVYLGHLTDRYNPLIKVALKHTNSSYRLNTFGEFT